MTAETKIGMTADEAVAESEILTSGATLHAGSKSRAAVMVTLATEVRRLRARVAELEAARGEPVAYLHQVVCGDGEPDQALSFAPDNFPLAGVLGYRSLSHEPLYTAPPAPTVDVDAISDDLIDEATAAFIGNDGGICNPKTYRDDMRAALRAIFNKGE